MLISNFAHKEGQYIDYGLMSLQSPWKIQDANRRIIDTRLTRIFCRY